MNFAREIRAGGDIYTNAKVTAIARTRTGWEVTAGEVFEGRNLVNAAGAWADDVAIMAGLPSIGLQAFRRSVARISAPADHDVSRWPMFMGAAESWYAKPDAGALIVSPAEADPVSLQDAWANDMVLAEGIARYEEQVTEPVTRMIANWAGLRTFAPDHNLVLGPAPQDNSFIWCAGQGGYGFQTSPAASQLLADVVAGRETVLGADAVAELSPARFS